MDVKFVNYFLVLVVIIYFLNICVNCGFFVYFIYKLIYVLNYKLGKNYLGSFKLIGSGRGVLFVVLICLLYSIVLDKG